MLVAKHRLMGCLAGAGAAICGFSASPVQAQQDCADLRGAVIGHAIVVDAVVEEAGEFTLPEISGLPPIDLPAHCRLVGVSSPETGSRIEFELWVPREGWNGRLRMFGNGGYSSRLPREQMAAALADGFAATATDTGHKGDDPDFAIGRPQAIVDWGHRAVHETIVAAKELVFRISGKSADYTYFEGCSTGGHQALMSAQRYPEDFDGIIAGAPGHNRTRLNIAFLWDFVVNHRADGSLILGADKLSMLNAAVLRQCGGPLERQRGYLADPLSCRFDPRELVCHSDSTGHCLSADEAEAASRLYAGPRNPRTGQQIYPGFVPGSEMGWPNYWADPARPSQPARANFFRFWAFDDPAWQWRDFDFDRSLEHIDPAIRAAIDATDPDLTAYQRDGGKLILYHGLMDAVVSPADTLAYYRSASHVAGETADEFLRYFGIPGLAHCIGGPGPGLTDVHDAISTWVERGRAPTSLTDSGR